MSAINSSYVEPEGTARGSGFREIKLGRNEPSLGKPC